MKITSNAFKDGEEISKKYTADGENVNPPLEVSEIPAGTKQLVLIVDDPDAPEGNYRHWIAILSPTKHIKENSKEKILSMPNDFGKYVYMGPAPPRGQTHRYFFKIFALDMILPLTSSGEINSEKFEIWMKEHVIEQAQIMGKYGRN